MPILSLILLAPAAAIAAPAASEPEVWALVAKVGTAAAYEVYLDRFPDGPNRDAAEQAHRRLGGQRAIRVPPPMLVASGPAPCYALFYARPASGPEPEEQRVFSAARRSNRPADYQTYLDRFPAGACREPVTRFLEGRRLRALRFGPVPGLGPLAPHRLRSSILTVEDYPAEAIRAGESGIVAAEWEVAEDGAVEGCRVVRSSGSATLDAATCRLFTVRMRYDPARDAAGAVVRSTDRVTIHWRLPPPDPPLPRPRS